MKKAPFKLSKCMKTRTACMAGACSCSQNMPNTQKSVLLPGSQLYTPIRTATLCHYALHARTNACTDMHDPVIHTHTTC
jgi:hypothetical protein